MNEKEAELIGAHIGDGTLYLSGKTLVWELRGSIYEQDYYAHMSQLINDLFSVEIKPKYRGPNSYGIQTTNKTITQFFIGRGFSPGKKVYTVKVPDYIKAAQNSIKQTFIRGLFDTDGCIVFEKNRTPYHYYPRIEFSFASKNLRDDLIFLFDDLGFKSHHWQTTRKDGMEFKVSLAGFLNLDNWTTLIEPANSKHLIRIERGLANKDKVALKRVSKNISLKSP